MKRIVSLVLAFALTLMLIPVSTAAAIGPTRAAEVGNNPHVFVNPVNQKTALNTTNGDQSALDRITWYGNQICVYLNVSNVQGFNNAMVADYNTVQGMIANPHNYENKWIYLSGENSGNSFDGHGMFYWWIRSQGFSDEQAIASILARNPDGGYVKVNYVGPDS